MYARFASISILSLAVLFVGGCDDSRASAGGVVVAAEGGVISADTVTLSIPADSLTADTEVTLSAVALSELGLALEGGQSTAFRIEPEGTVLTSPATVVIDGASVDGAAEASVAVHQLLTVDGTRWVPVESSRDASGAVSVVITRFAPLGLVVSEPGSAGTIRGVLSWGDASPVDGAPLELWGNDVMVGTSTTDANGNFSFGDLDAGTYSIQLDFECALSETVTLGAGETQELALTLCG